MNTYYDRCRYLVSAAEAEQSPPDNGVEIAFAGRSNAGKSSAINAICRNKSLARTSRTPGRTQLLNFFWLDDERRIVDLPGYGFAKVPGEEKAHWGRMIGGYLETRQCLKGIVIVMDVRKPMTDYDQQMLDWSRHAQLPVHILLTKCDKPKYKETLAALDTVQAQLQAGETAQLFSALKRYGIDEAHERLDSWFGLEARVHST